MTCVYSFSHHLDAIEATSSSGRSGWHSHYKKFVCKEAVPAPSPSFLFPHSKLLSWTSITWEGRGKEKQGSSPGVAVCWTCSFLVGVDSSVLILFTLTDKQAIPKAILCFYSSLFLCSQWPLYVCSRLLPSHSQLAVAIYLLVRFFVDFPVLLCVFGFDNLALSVVRLLFLLMCSSLQIERAGTSSFILAIGSNSRFTCWIYFLVLNKLLMPARIPIAMYLTKLAMTDYRGWFEYLIWSFSMSYSQREPFLEKLCSICFGHENEWFNKVWTVSYR